jgi:hypothetical protein
VADDGAGIGVSVGQMVVAHQRQVLKLAAHAHKLNALGYLVDVADAWQDRADIEELGDARFLRQVVGTAEEGAVLSVRYLILRYVFSAQPEGVTDSFCWEGCARRQLPSAQSGAGGLT